MAQRLGVKRIRRSMVENSSTLETQLEPISGVWECRGLAIGELVGGQVVEGEVQVEDVDAGFTEEAELALGGVIVDEVDEG
jgi:hypothetical protein